MLMKRNELRNLSRDVDEKKSLIQIQGGGCQVPSFRGWVLDTRAWVRAESGDSVIM